MIKPRGPFIVEVPHNEGAITGTVSDYDQVVYVGIVPCLETIAEINLAQCASWAYKGRLALQWNGCGSVDMYKLLL